jgi:hypothetical protein
VGALELGRAVEEVALLDLVEGRAAEQLLHLGAPALELVAQEADALLAVLERERVGRQVEECVPAVRRRRPVSGPQP